MMVECGSSSNVITAPTDTWKYALVASKGACSRWICRAAVLNRTPRSLISGICPKWRRVRYWGGWWCWGRCERFDTSQCRWIEWRWRRWIIEIVMWVQRETIVKLIQSLLTDLARSRWSVADLSVTLLGLDALDPDRRHVSRLSTSIFTWCLITRCRWTWWGNAKGTRTVNKARNSLKEWWRWRFVLPILLARCCRSLHHRCALPQISIAKNIWIFLVVRQALLAFSRGRHLFLDTSFARWKDLWWRVRWLEAISSQEQATGIIRAPKKMVYPPKFKLTPTISVLSRILVRLSCQKQQTAVIILRKRSQASELRCALVVIDGRGCK